MLSPCLFLAPHVPARTTRHFNQLYTIFVAICTTSVVFVVSFEWKRETNLESLFSKSRSYDYPQNMSSACPAWSAFELYSVLPPSPSFPLFLCNTRGHMPFACLPLSHKISRSTTGRQVVAGPHQLRGGGRTDMCGSAGCFASGGLVDLSTDTPPLLPENSWPLRDPTRQLLLLAHRRPWGWWWWWLLRATPSAEVAGLTDLAEGRRRRSRVRAPSRRRGIGSTDCP